MSSRRTWLRWGLRIAGLALVGFVLATQVRWHDTIRLVDGSLSARGFGESVVAGSVKPLADGSYEVSDDAFSDSILHLRVPAGEVARRDVGGRSVPDVVYGLPSLARRLAGHVPVVALVLAVLASIVVLTSWRWWRLVRALDLRLPFGQAVRLSWIGLFFNIAVPGATGGDVVKAYYTARVLGAPTRAVVSVFVDRVLGLFALVLLAGGAVLLAPGDPAYDTPKRLVLFCLLGAIVGGSIVLSRRLRRALGLTALLKRLPFVHVLAEADAALRLYRGKPREVGFAILLSLGNHVGQVFAAWLLAGALGMRDLGLAPLFVVVPLASLISAVPLLPGGWGVGEVAYAWLLQPFGVAATEAVSLSVLLRLASLAVGLPGGLLWGLWRSAPSRAVIAEEMDRAVDTLERQEAGQPAAVPADAVTDLAVPIALPDGASPEERDA